MSAPLVEWLHKGRTFIGTPQQLVDELTYANYRYNRQHSPEISPERWKVVFGSKVELMEQRYQQELMRKSDGRDEPVALRQQPTR